MSRGRKSNSGSGILAGLLAGGVGWFLWVQLRKTNSKILGVVPGPSGSLGVFSPADWDNFPSTTNGTQSGGGVGADAAPMSGPGLGGPLMAGNQPSFAQADVPDLSI